MQPLPIPQKRRKPLTVITYEDLKEKGFNTEYVFFGDTLFSWDELLTYEQRDRTKEFDTLCSGEFYKLLEAGYDEIVLTPASFHKVVLDCGRLADCIDELLCTDDYAPEWSDGLSDTNEGYVLMKEFVEKFNENQTTGSYIPEPEFGILYRF